MAVMPYPSSAGDLPGLLRTEYSNLEDPAWWKSLDLDGVILYSWAAPRFTSVARAIKHAEIRLLVCMDTCGVISRQSNPASWFRDMPVRIFHEGPWGILRMREVVKYIVESLFSPVAKERIAHYKCADIVTVPTPEGMEWVRNEAIKLGGEDLARRFRYLPHPQSQDFHYTGIEKERLVVSIARWEEQDWGQKNPRLLIETFRRFLAARPGWRGIIIGSGATSLLGKLSLPPVAGLEFIERVEPSAVPGYLNKARIGFWTSRWEGQQGAAAQALCCGCSVVSHRSTMVNCFRHYCSRDSGSLASRYAPEDLAAALCQEADAWEKGKRNPREISNNWAGEFHAKQTALRAIRMLGLL